MPTFGDYSRSTTVEDDARVQAGHRVDGVYDLPDDVAVGEWALWLPHDCNEWIIASGDAETVLTEGRKFVASVQAALAHIEIASRSGK